MWIEIRRLLTIWFTTKSLPAWGVWIEIRMEQTPGWLTMASLPAWGVWIEIPEDTDTAYATRGRSPHGECGLKLKREGVRTDYDASLPAWGVWIEIRHTTQRDLRG